MRFVASITVCPSDIQKLQRHVALARVESDPLKHLLITPLFVSPDSLRLAQHMSEEGSSVHFDSGGYHVQMGKLRFSELYMPLLDLYKSNQWATIYTLPDYVPLSQDEPEVVERKVRDTVSFSTLFFREMPDSLKPKAMPVVQGHNQAHIDFCLEEYIRLGVQQIGFGSFGTMGPNSEVNVATRRATDLARYVVDVAHSHNMKVHLFGLGAPPLVAMIKGIGADSFDSASWLKAAGFGMVSLPLMRFYNISYKSAIAELQRGVTFDQFEEWKLLTGHSCDLCKDLGKLREHKMYRAAHNLIVLQESVDMVNRGESARIRHIYRNGSVKYRTEFEKWLLKS